MRLYLSSHGSSDHLGRLRGMVGDNKKVLFIDNAKDDSSDNDRQSHVTEKLLEFKVRLE